VRGQLYVEPAPNISSVVFLPAEAEPSGPRLLDFMGIATFFLLIYLAGGASSFAIATDSSTVIQMSTTTFRQFAK